MNENRQEHDGPLYWALIGRLTPDNRLYHLPGILTEHPPRSHYENPSSPLRIDLLGDGGRLLVRQRLLQLTYSAEGGRSIEDRPIRAKVPFHPETRIIRFWNGDVLVNEWRRPVKEPVVDQLVVKRAQGTIRLIWQASHPSSAPMQFVVRLSRDGGKTFNRISGRLAESQLVVAEDSLPGGRGCVFQVAATDGVNTTTLESDPIDLPETPPKVLITWPPDGQEVVFGRRVLFSGQLVGFIGDDIAMASARWISDLDGELAQTPMFQTSKLSAGTHRITVVAQDRKGRGATATITVQVVEPKA